MAKITKEIAEHMQMEKRELLVFSALLHDIGKIKIPKYILLKNSALSSKEYEIVKRHPIDGVDILKSQFCDEEIDFSMVLLHHENINGSGYYLMNQKDIPYNARFLRIIDSYEAMTGIRSYKKPLTKKEAYEELKKYSGSYFDSEFIDEFISFMKRKDQLFMESSHLEDLI